MESLPLSFPFLQQSWNPFKASAERENWYLVFNNSPAVGGVDGVATSQVETCENDKKEIMVRKAEGKLK